MAIHHNFDPRIFRSLSNSEHQPLQAIHVSASFSLREMGSLPKPKIAEPRAGPGGRAGSDVTQGMTTQNCNDFKISAHLY